ncbi:MAG: hypothetical protein ACO3I1_04080 [Burkholderiales bacterium]
MKIKIPGSEPVITYEKYKKIIELRELKKKIKTYRELAKELNLHKGTVQSAASKGIKRYDYRMRKEGLISSEED